MRDKSSHDHYQFDAALLETSNYSYFRHMFLCRRNE